MPNAELAAQAVNTYRQATEQAFATLRYDLRAIADTAEREAELAGDAYHTELAGIADREGEQRAAAHQRCNDARAAALAVFTEATAPLHSGGPQ
jgi:hypothetical protein